MCNSNCICFWIIDQAREEENDPSALSRKKLLEEEAAKQRDAVLAADLFGTDKSATKENKTDSNNTRGAAFGIADDVPNSTVDSNSTNNSTTTTTTNNNIDIRPTGTRLEDCKFQEDAECEKVAQLISKKLMELQVRRIDSNIYTLYFNV